MFCIVSSSHLLVKLDLYDCFTNINTITMSGDTSRQLQAGKMPNTISSGPYTKDKRQTLAAIDPLLIDGILLFCWVDGHSILHNLYILYILGSSFNHNPWISIGNPYLSNGPFFWSIWLSQGSQCGPMVTLRFKMHVKCKAHGRSESVLGEDFTIIVLTYLTWSQFKRQKPWDGNWCGYST